LKHRIFASQFLPKNFWLIIGAILTMAVFFICISFWASGRFGGSRMWVVGGMFAGGIGAASWQIGLVPIGTAVGAVVGCVASVVATKLTH